MQFSSSSQSSTNLLEEGHGLFLAHVSGVVCTAAVLLLDW